MEGCGVKDDSDLFCDLCIVSMWIADGLILNRLLRRDAEYRICRGRDEYASTFLA